MVRPPCHREGVGAQGGQTAVCQQQRLEQQHDDADDAHGRGTEQQRTQTGAGGVRARAGHAWNLQRGQHKGISARHCQNQQSFAVLRDGFFDGEKSCHQKRQTQRTPDNRVSHRQIPLHDVHGAGAGWQSKQHRRSQAQGEQAFFTFLHGQDHPFCTCWCTTGDGVLPSLRSQNDCPSFLFLRQSRRLAIKPKVKALWEHLPKGAPKRGIPVGFPIFAPAIFHRPGAIPHSGRSSGFGILKSGTLPNLAAVSFSASPPVQQWRLRGLFPTSLFSEQLFGLPCT